MISHLATAASSPGPLGSRLLLSGPGDNLSELADDGRDHLVKEKTTGSRLGKEKPLELFCDRLVEAYVHICFSMKEILSR